MTARSRRHVTTLVGLAALTAAWSEGCEGLGEPKVLSVGNRSFTVRDLRAIHASMDPNQRVNLATREEREQFAETVVERTLLEEFGERLVATGKVNIDDELAAAREDLLVRRLRTLEGSDVALDSATVRDAYGRMRTRSRVRTLLFGAESQARQGLELGHGRGLVTLPEYAERGTHESWVSWSPLPDPVADAVTGHSAGEVLGPVESRGWWLLVEIVEQRPGELDPYPQMRPRILRGLRVREETMRTRELLDRLSREASLRVDDEVVAMLADRTREAVLREGAAEADADWAVPRLGADEKPRIVVGWSTGQITATDFVEMISGLPRGQRPRSAGLETAIRTMTVERAERRLLAAEAKSRGLERDWWVQRAIAADRSDRMARVAALNIEREAAVGSDREELIRTLQDAQPQLFRRGVRARVLRFDFRTRELAEAELAAIRRAGGGRERLREIVTAPYPVSGVYHLLELERAMVSDESLRDAIFERPVGRPAGPFEALGLWVVAVCLEIIPEQEMTEEEIRRAGVALSRVASSIPEWIERRRAEVGVSIDHDALTALGPGG